MVRGRVRERERGELPDRVTYIQHCLESDAERESERRGRERERDKRMQRSYRNGKHSDDTAGEKDEKERMPKQRNIETNRGPSISYFVNLSILFIHSFIHSLPISPFCCSYH